MECDDNVTSENTQAVCPTSSLRDVEASTKTSNNVSISPRPVSISVNAHDSNVCPAAVSNNNKVLGHNYNGTVVFTSSPKNEAELQLYRVMQKASLLSYYDTLLEMGGDDVQQLCDAGEEEFLEIMALVGMASKPLHVRRFQKALQEWLSTPLMFQSSISAPTSSISSSSSSSSSLSSLGLLPRPLSVHNVSSSPMSCHVPLTNTTTPPISSPNNTPIQVGSHQWQLGEISSCTSVSLSPAHGSTSSVSPGPSPGSPLQTQNSQPILDEKQIKKLEEAALRLVQNLPELEPKYHSTKKKVGKELQAVLNMSDDDPFRMQHIRKFSAIYGRFDCKRRPEKPLTLHEVSVNEAAAQICKYIPALLTRRDELFPLARQVVRDSGYHYSKGHSKSYAVSNLTRTTSLANTFKFNDNFTKRKSNENSVSFDSNRNEEKLNLLKSELQKITAKLDQLTPAMQNISEETSEFSALKYQIEAFNRQKLQLLEEYECLAHLVEIPRKRGRKSTNHSSEADEIDSQYLYNDDVDPIDLEHHDNEEDTKDSNIVYIHQDATSRSGDESDEEEKLNEVHHKFSKSALRNEKDQEFLSDNFKEKYYADDKFQVIASKGDDIIAVTNPALRMSSTSVTSPTTGLILKKERLSPVEFDDVK